MSCASIGCCDRCHRVATSNAFVASVRLRGHDPSRTVSRRDKAAQKAQLSGREVRELCDLSAARPTSPEATHVCRVVPFEVSSSEVDPEPPFRFNRNGKGSKPAYVNSSTCCR